MIIQTKKTQDEKYFPRRRRKRKKLLKLENGDFLL
jgi:hypothetical protein